MSDLSSDDSEYAAYCLFYGIGRKVAPISAAFSTS